jgi:hypothetical protein
MATRQSLRCFGKKIDPLAEETVTFSIGAQVDQQTPSPGPYIPLGTDQRPKLKWVKKTWNKLGFYLHAEWPFAKSVRSAASLRVFLEETLKTLSPLVHNTFNMSMIHPIITFVCSNCRQEVRTAAMAIEIKRSAVCLACGKRYKALKVDEEFRMVPDGPSVNCNCGVENYVRSEDLKEGYKLTCRGCQATIEFMAPQWQCRIFPDVDSESEASSEE